MSDKTREQLHDEWKAAKNIYRAAREALQENLTQEFGNFERIFIPHWMSMRVSEFADAQIPLERKEPTLPGKPYGIGYLHLEEEYDYRVQKTYLYAFEIVFDKTKGVYIIPSKTRLFNIPVQGPVFTEYESRPFFQALADQLGYPVQVQIEPNEQGFFTCTPSCSEPVEELS